MITDKKILNEISKNGFPTARKHLSTNDMYYIVARMCRFLLREVISPRGRFFDEQSEVAKEHRALFEWCGSKRPYEPDVVEDSYSVDLV